VSSQEKYRALRHRALRKTAEGGFEDAFEDVTLLLSSLKQSILTTHQERRAGLLS